MGTLSRRALLRMAALGAAASAAACAVPTAAPLAPAGSVTTQQTARPTPWLPWTEPWADAYAAARAEGRLSLLTLVGSGYAAVIERFGQLFPGISIDHFAESSAGVWLARVRQERRAGLGAFDLALVLPARALTEGRPEGLWAPLRPLLFSPDVLDDRAWRDGLSARFMDASGELCFDWEYQVVHAYAINTELVPEGEIRTVKDLLDPKWRGRIISLDARLGSGLLSAASVAHSWGPEVVKQLLVDQQPTFMRGGPGEIVEPLARGSHPIALGVRPKALRPLQQAGRGQAIKYLDLPDADFVVPISMFYFDQAPHPAAARLFANWILTREGQTLLSGALFTNSARTDVEPFEPDGIATTGRTYYEPDREANYAHLAQTQQLVHALLGSSA